MSTLADTDTRRRVFLVAAVADLHPETAKALLEGKPATRKTRDAIVRARGNLDTIKDELTATLDRLAGDAATATNGGAT